MIDSVILFWLWSKVYTLQSNINYRPSGCLRSPGIANTVGILTMHDVQSVICWSFKNNIYSNNEKFYISYMMTNQLNLPSVQEYWFVKNNHIFCVKMTKIQRFFSGATCNKMQVVDDLIDLDEMTLGQGHDTS